MSVSTVTKDISFEGMALDALAEMANLAGEQVETHAKTAVTIAIRAGKALVAAKAQVPHGEWLGWLKANWNYSQQMACNYMQIANYKRASNLEDANSVREALRIVALDPETPKRERKTGQVDVVTPDKSDRAEPRHKDDDPNPAPRTNTHHTQGTRKKREDEKPRTAAIPVAAEIVEPDDEDEADRREAALGQLAEIVEILGMTTVLKVAVNVDCDDSDKKERAALLRKVADALDPAGSTVSAPVKAKAERTGATPTADQLVKLIPGTWPKVLQAAAQDWCEHKQSLPRRERIQSTKAWLKAVELMSAQPADRVAAKINKAISNNWKGWDHNDGNNNKASDQLYRNPGPRAPVKYDNVPG